MRRIENDFAWSVQITVSSEYRGRGIARSLRYEALKAVRSKGISCLMGGALIGNKASLGLARSIGFETVCDIYYTRILGFEKTKYDVKKQHYAELVF